jgi:hypothetical protein
MVDISKVYMTGLGASPCLFVSVCVLYIYIHVILYAYIIIYKLCIYIYYYIYIIHVLNKRLFTIVHIILWLTVVPFFPTYIGVKRFMMVKKMCDHMCVCI